MPGFGRDHENKNWLKSSTFLENNLGISHHDAGDASIHPSFNNPLHTSPPGHRCIAENHNCADQLPSSCSNEINEHDKSSQFMNGVKLPLKRKYAEGEAMKSSSKMLCGSQSSDKGNLGSREIIVLDDDEVQITKLHQGEGNLGSPEIIMLDDDEVDIMLITDVSQRSVSGRLSGDECQLSATTCNYGHSKEGNHMGDDISGRRSLEMMDTDGLLVYQEVASVGTSAGPTRADPQNNQDQPSRRQAVEEYLRKGREDLKGCERMMEMIRSLPHIHSKAHMEVANFGASADPIAADLQNNQDQQSCRRSPEEYYRRGQKLNEEMMERIRSLPHIHSKADMEELNFGASAGRIAADLQNNQDQQSRRRSPEEYLRRGQKLHEEMMEKLRNLPREFPKVTISHTLRLKNMAAMMKIARTFWDVGHLTDEELWLYIEGLLRAEEAGMSSDTIMRRLKTRDYVQLTNLSKCASMDINLETCSICTVEYKNQDKIARLYYCRHEFHADCMMKWLLVKNSCPICRALALIPEKFPDWDGDVGWHIAYFTEPVIIVP